MLDKLKNYFNRSPTVVRYELMTVGNNGFFNWNGKMYSSDIIRACIRPRVKSIGKAVAKHIREVGDDIKINPEPYIKMLLKKPNPYMTFQMLIEKTDTQLQLNNNAYIYVNRDENGYPMELYPINATTVYAIYDKNGYLYLKFMLINGKTVTLPYTDIIHLRDDFGDNDIFGTSPIEALRPVMEVINTTDQGFVKAIKNSGVIKWLLKFKTNTRPEQIKKETAEFVKNYMDTESDSIGAAGIDPRYDAIQMEPKDYVPNAAQMDRSIKRVYSFFNTNEKIVQSSYNENEWNAYYESVIEPRLMQYAECLTDKLFTKREIAFGNYIILETSNLQYASMTTKLSLLQMVDRGAMTANEWRKILGMGPIEGGNKVVRRLDTAVVETKGGDENEDD